jgi:acetyl/propionyl-CoA carboxylase alpha subunit
VYAEDSRRLLPQTGRLLRYREPHGAGVRVDSGVAEGQAISVHYDPLIAKLITHGAARDDALDTADAALRAFEILGVHHNIGFLRALLARDEVRAASLHTRFIEAHLDELTRPPAAAIQRAMAAVAAYTESTSSDAAATRLAASSAAEGDGAVAPVVDPWDLLGPIAWFPEPR